MELNNSYDIRHPVYDKYLNRWLMAWDFFRGGLHVFSPENPMVRTRVAYNQGLVDASYDVSLITSTVNLESSLPRKLSKYSWKSSYANSYLYKHAKEDIEEYDDRQYRQINYPIFQYTINSFVTGILKEKPDRASQPEAAPGFFDDIDFCGTDIDALMRHALAMSLCFGRIHAIVDKPLYAEKAINLQQQLFRGERPYVYLVSPLDIADWQQDKFGNFIWIKIKEAIVEEERQPYQEPKSNFQYRIWDRQRWYVMGYTKEGRWEMVDEGDHGLGIVPLATCFATKSDHSNSMDIETPFADILDINRDILNKLSELDEVERTQTFSILIIPEEDGAIGAIDIAPNRCLTSASQGAQPSYVSPSAELSTGKMARIESKIRICKELAGTSRGVAQYSREERSAQALDIEMEEKRNQMTLWSNAIEEFDMQINKIANLWQGKEVDKFAEYDKSFQTSMNRQPGKKEEEGIEIN